MRTDVKVIAIVVAVLVVVVAVWYVVYVRPSSRSRTSEVAVAPPPGPENTNVVESPLPAPTEPVPSPYAEPAPRPPAPTTPPGVDLGTLEVPSRLTPSATPPAEKTYTVQRGDSYRSLALREYGREALAYLIEKANPNIPPSRLVAGLTIKIPPPPAPSQAPTPTPPAVTAAPGATVVDPVTGKRYYVVKQGDNGFWGVAQAVYGNGKEWQAVEKANPGVKPTALRMGQKLWVPEAIAAAPGATPPVETAVRPILSATHPLTTSAPPPHLRTGAPARETLPDGRTFD